MNVYPLYIQQDAIKANDCVDFCFNVPCTHSTLLEPFVKASFNNDIITPMINHSCSYTI